MTARTLLVVAAVTNPLTWAVAALLLILLGAALLPALGLACGWVLWHWTTSARLTARRVPAPVVPAAPVDVPAAPPATAAPVPDLPAELARQLGVLRDLLNASITDLITAE